MNVLHVIQFFNPKYGGTVQSCYYQSKYLAERGHKVTIYTTNYNFNQEYANSLSNVRIIPFHCQANMQSFFYSPRMKKQLKKDIKTLDIIHLHNFRTYQNVVVHRYARKNNIPYILQAHGDLPFFEKSGLKILYDLVWGKRILTDVTKVIALTKQEAELYKEMGVYEEKIEIIPNGIDLSIFSHLPEKGTFKVKYDIPLDTKVVLYLGRLHKIKGIDLLIDAFSEVQKKLPMSKLVIVGPDEGCLKNLQRQSRELNVENNIMFIGPLYGQDKLAAYIDANVYVLPSIFEIFGYTVLEAWACGTPVIVTKGCCISDFVEKAGYVVNYNKNELKDAIIKTLNNEDEIEKFKENGKRFIMQTFNIDSCIKKIENLYLSLLQNISIHGGGGCLL